MVQMRRASWRRSTKTVLSSCPSQLLRYLSSFTITVRVTERRLKCSQLLRMKRSQESQVQRIPKSCHGATPHTQF